MMFVRTNTSIKPAFLYEILILAFLFERAFQLSRTNLTVTSYRLIWLTRHPITFLLRLPKTVFNHP
ncbi:hypothetical protein PS880_03410 [Pseudomonas fluorescens]|uniref:Uncharacterized protein n=1 Tax=Pseudomonas fluorescens TaxID=294 RepID=A0A5E7LMP5_PSEFL|nr:hypothetical protein PS880_03410 [Pseudomonas fluorescens]